MLVYINLAIFFRLFGILAPRDFKIIWLSNLLILILLLFRKRVVRMRIESDTYISFHEMKSEAMNVKYCIA